MSEDPISAILKAIVANDPAYVLDGQFVRWGKVEADLKMVVEQAVNKERSACEEAVKTVRPLPNDDRPGVRQAFAEGNQQSLDKLRARWPNSPHYLSE